jgi:uncharacterized delta-60 repeat protein
MTSKGSLPAGGLERLEPRAYLAAGDLDGWFNDGAVRIHPQSADHAKAVAVQPDGRVIVAGRVIEGPDQGWGVARYNADGSPDRTFGGGDGRVYLPFESPAYVHGVAVAPDGRIVVAGGVDLDFAVMRLNADGTPDTTFDGDGNDQLFALDGAVDTLDGGAGFDRSKRDPIDLLTNAEGLLS